MGKITYRDRVFEVVSLIPEGLVATYGQIARMVPNCTARMVGYALASLPAGSDIPWQRVINFKGRISPHGAGYGSLVQRQRLEDEGIEFNDDQVIDLNIYGWQPD